MEPVRILTEANYYIHVNDNGKDKLMPIRDSEKNKYQNVV